MGHSYKDSTQLAKSHGFRLWKQCRSSHEIWRNDSGQTILISRCGSRDGRAIKNFKSEIKRKTQNVKTN